jgi:hypothetical protein
LNDNSKFISNKEDPNYDRLFKVRPFITEMRKNFLEIEKTEFLSVDEIIVPFKGRSNLKQYIKNKPHKWGIKIFALADSKGFVYDFEIYTGKGTVKSDRTSLGISGDIVVRLLESVPKSVGYKVFFDNWFSSYSLLLKLNELGYLCTGTVRPNRINKCPLQKDSELKAKGRGSIDYKTDQENDIIVIKWFDNRAVHLISNNIGIEPTDEALRWSQKDQAHIKVSRPAAIREFNSNMGGVDLNDMLVSLYR